MALLSKNYFELGRGYKKRSEKLFMPVHFGN